jgi:tellurite resistance protein
LSIGVSAGSAVAAKSILVPATLWNTITHSLGFGSGFMVSGMTYSLAAVYAPIALGGVAFLVSMKGLKKLEKNRLSDFLADVIIASIPMIFADGIVHDDEILAINTLMADPTILDKDRKRIEEAMTANLKLEDIVANHLMHEKNAAKAEIKSRLLLSIAMQIAKADGKVDKKELEVHRKMSRIFKVEENYCEEVRTLLLPATT